MIAGELKEVEEESLNICCTHERGKERKRKRGKEEFGEKKKVEDQNDQDICSPIKIDISDNETEGFTEGVIPRKRLRQESKQSQMSKSTNLNSALIVIDD